MESVLVAGGAGFIGSHLTDRLLERGVRVVCVDDFSTGRASNLAHRSTEVSAGRLVIVEHDVSEPGTTARLDAHGPFDAVLHLASPASPTAYLARPIETLRVGSEGTRELLDLAVANGARFVLASTSEVYGDPLVHPQVEGYFGNVNPVGPRSCYDEAKRFAESLTVAYGGEHRLSYGIARIFNTYGPRMRLDDGRVVTNFIVQALRGDPLTIYGSGAQTRSFCHVSDQVAGQLALLDSDESGPVNIGNPDEISVRELAELVVELTGSSSSVEEHPLPVDDPQLRCPDITLAADRLGWSPTVALVDGLGETIAAVRAEL